MYIAENLNSRIRKVTVSTGIITTIAGTGMSSYSGDGGAATSAALKYPAGVAVDVSGYDLSICFYHYILIYQNLLLGNVYISDWGNHRIRKVTVSTGIITTFAGTGSSSYSGDNGPATSASLYYPFGIVLDSTGTQVNSINSFLIFKFDLLTR